MTLQASNDITVASPVRADNPAGSGGAFTLQAGRRLDFRAGVRTDDGALTGVAGDPGADPAFRDPGTPTVAIGAGATLDVGGAAARLAAIGGDFVNGAGAGALATAGAGRWLVWSRHPDSTVEGFAAYGKHYAERYAGGAVPAYAAGGNWFLYETAPTLTVAPVGRTATYGEPVPAFTPTYGGFIDGDTASTAGLAGAPAWSVAGPSSTSGHPGAGGHAVSYAGGLASSLGYALAAKAPAGGELLVTPRPLDAAYSGRDKAYDGGFDAVVDAAPRGLVAGDVVTFTQTARFRDRRAGGGRPIDVTGIALGGTDAGNYALSGDSATTSAAIAPRPLSASLAGTVAKVYDGSTAATLAADNLRLGGVVEGDAVTVTASGAAYEDRNAGGGKAVSVAAVALGGGDAGNYTVAAPATARIGSIATAPLAYVADKATGTAGAPVAPLSGSVAGFVPGDDAAGATRGTARWSTPATPASPPGSYPVEGSGLSAANYHFVQAPGNATALTLDAPPVDVAAVSPSVQGLDAALRGALAPRDGGAGGRFPRVADWSAAPLSSGDALFEAVDLSLLSRDEMQRLLDARREFKERLFFNAIHKLREDPSLAEVRPCPALADVQTGLCRMTEAQRLELAAREQHSARPRPRNATLPQIERKVVLLIGINRYADRRIPQLKNAVPDAETLGRLFAEKLGYEARVVRDATRADIFRTLNQLAAEIDPNDSVIVYYAGHGYLDEQTGIGYWVPSDASSSDPASWVSNGDISKMLSSIRARQLAMISDSCYSGAFARERASGLAGRRVEPDEVRARRSVIVMSSGGDEPVADSGRGGHSIFAWQLMQALRNVERWQPGNTVFEEVQREVSRAFPQTPRYGTSASAGHQPGGEYLFEVRQLEERR